MPKPVARAATAYSRQLKIVEYATFFEKEIVRIYWNPTDSFLDSSLLFLVRLEILVPLFNKSIISARPVLCWYIFDARGKSLLAITLEMKPQQQQVHQFLGQEEPALIFAKYLIALILSTYLCIIKSKSAFYIEV